MMTKILMFLQSVVLTLLFFGCAQQPVDGSMGGWNHMMGYGGYGGMYMWLVLIIIAGVVVYFIFQQNKKNRDLEDPARESPMEILKRRYAKGEITKEEFERLKEEIEG